MSNDIPVVNNDVELNRQYILARDKLNISLRLYRLAIIYNVISELPGRYSDVVQCQVVFEQLYAQLHPDLVESSCIRIPKFT